MRNFEPPAAIDAAVAWNGESSFAAYVHSQFDASLKKGSLSVISGRIAKQSPDAMTLRTPSAILGVRGTEFVVSVDD